MQFDSSGMEKIKMQGGRCLLCTEHPDELTECQQPERAKSHPPLEGKGCITQGKEVITVIMIKPFGVDCSDASKQVTVVIEGSVLIT